MNKTKNAIFQSAIKIFSNNGYDGATMDEIASNAGLAKGTLYYHFKSKQEIFKYIVTEGMNMLRYNIEDQVEKEENSINKLKKFFKLQLSLVYYNRDFFKVIMSQLWGEELRNIQLRDLIEQYIKVIERHLKTAMEDGAIIKGDSYFMACTIFGNLCSAAVYELMNKNEIDIDEVIDNLMNYILKGIQI